MILKPEIAATTMFDDMTQFGIDCATLALVRHESNNYRKMAEYIKGEFDKRYGGYWGVCIGKRDQFNTFFHVQEFSYLSFYMGDIRFIILKPRSL
jgi:hypothetical protein